MKRGTKIALLTALILIAVGATLCSIARGRGENLEALIDEDALSLQLGQVNFGIGQAGYSVSSSGEESFAANEVTALELSWISGSVRVERYDGDTIVVMESCAQALREGQRMRWKLTDGRLSVIACANGERRLPNKSLQILVPRDWLGKDISADAASASVTLEGLSISGRMELNTASGKVQVEDCVCGELKIDTASGEASVERTAVDGGFETNTVSGAVQLEGCSFRELEVKTTSGAVTLRFAEKPGAIQVDTVSGNVSLRVPKGTKLDVQYDSVSGRLSGNYLSAGDGVSVQVDTVSGGLTIEEG